MAGPEEFGQIGHVTLCQSQSPVIILLFLEMCPGDLAGEQRVVVGDIGLRVPAAVLHLHLEPHAELGWVEGGSVPVDAEGLTDGPGLVDGEMKRCLLMIDEVMPGDRIT